MPYCPACRGEFRDGFEWCERCRQPLVAELPPDLTDPDEMARRLAGRELTPLLGGPLLDLKSLREELGRAGIPCVIGPPAGEEGCGTASCAPRLALYVAAEEESRARELLELEKATEGSEVAAAPEERCPACGAAGLGGQEVCPGCGLFLGG